MTSILDNELIKKHFDEGLCAGRIGLRCWHSRTPNHLGCMAYRVIQAMETPINHGDRYLNIQRSDVFIAEQSPGWKSQDRFHPDELRLPDAFQPKVETEPTQTDRLNGIGCGCCPCHHDTDCRWYKKPENTPKPDRVEEKIKEFIDWANAPPTPVLEEKLRALVALVRGEGR